MMQYNQLYHHPDLKLNQVNTIQKNGGMVLKILLI